MVKLVGDENTNILVGTAAKDSLFGRGGNDQLFGQGDDDQLFGEDGRDRLIGGAGKDALNGGSGTDIAVYSGLPSDYKVTTRNGVTTVKDLRSGTPDGTDTLTNVERIEFADGTIFYIVPNQAPAAAGDAATVDEDALYSSAVSVLANDSDADVDPIEVASVNGIPLVSGQATATLGSGAIVSFHSDGQYTFDTNGAYEQLAVGETATEVISYAIADGHGGTSTSTLTITINGVNDSPIAADDLGYAFTAGEDYADLAQFNVLFNDSDPDNGDSLTITAIDTTGVQGTMQIWGGGNSLLYTPNPAAFQYLALGEFAYETVIYTVSDESGATDSATMTIRIDGKNDAPIASDDTGAGNEDSLIIGSVASNDSDVDNGAVLNYALVGAAPAGLTFNPDGSWSLDASHAAYQHIAQGASEDVIVSYTGTDEHGASDTAVLTITVQGVNDAAVVQAGPQIILYDTSAPDALASVDGNLTASDVDGNGPFTFALAGSIADGSIAGFDRSATLQSLGKLYLNSSTGAYRFVPDSAAIDTLPAGSNVPKHFFFSVTDGDGLTSELSLDASLFVNIFGANDDVVVSGPVVGTATEDGESVTLNALANAYDPEHQPWGTPLELVSVPVVLPAGVSFDPATDNFTLDPSDAVFQELAVGETQIVTVNYGVSDGNATTPASVSWTVAGSNDAPTAENASLGETTIGAIGIAFGGFYGTSAGPDYQPRVIHSFVDSDGDGLVDQPAILSPFTGSSGNNWGLAAGDLDGDGDLDLAVVAGGEIATLTNIGDTNGDGAADYVRSTLLSGQTNNIFDVTITDLNGDGLLDIVATGSGFYEYINAGDTDADGLANNFTGRSVAGVAGLGYGVASGDLNGDGRNDLVFTNYFQSGPVEIQFNLGDTNADGMIDYQAQTIAELPNANSAGVDLGDVDGDGDLDMVISRFAGSEWVYFNDGDQNGDSQLEFTPIQLPTGGDTLESEFADIDGDGDLDIISAHDGGWITVSYNDGDTNGDGRPNFSVATHYGLSATVRGLAVGDLDGDGDLDIVVPGTTDTSPSQYFTNLGDLNGDGRPEFTAVELDGVPPSWDAEFMIVPPALVYEDDAFVSGSFSGDDIDSDDDPASLSFVVTADPELGSVAKNQDGTFTFALGDDFQFLAEGEQRIVTFNYAAVDSHGATSAPATVSITVTGVNDDPAFSQGGVAEGQVTELANLSAGENATLHTVAGALPFTDADVNDSHEVSSIAYVSEYLGDFTAAIDPETRELNWSFSVEDSAIDGLAAGETITQIYTIYFADQAGVEVSHDVTVTITGSSDNNPPVAGDDVLDNGPGFVASNELPINTTTLQDQRYPEVVTLGDGSFLATWLTHVGSTGFHLYGQRYDASGAELDDEFQVIPVPVDYFYAITALDNGGYAVASQTVDGSIRIESFDASGLGTGPITTLGEFDGYSYEHPSIASLSNGGFVVVWQTNAFDSLGYTDIRAQRFDASGSPDGSPVPVNVASLNDHLNQDGAQVTGLAGGGFVVTWASPLNNGDIHAQRFDALGPQGDLILVNANVVGGQASPAITALADGGFVIAWESLGADNTGIFVRRYDADGMALDDGQLVNDLMPAGSQVSVSALSDGGFVVSWIGFETDGSGNNIYARAFGPGGLPSAADFLVNVTTSDQQTQPALAPLDNGFVAVWVSEGQDGSLGGIIGRTFTTSPTTNEDEVLIINTADLLANDQDPETDPLAITGVSSESNLGASVTLNGDGTISYDPTSALDYLAAGETATDSFNYTVSDGNGGSATATVALTVQGADDGTFSYQHVTLANLGGQMEIDLDSGTLSTDSPEADLGFVGVGGIGPYTPQFYATGDGLWMAHLDGVDIDSLTADDIASADFVFVPGTDDPFFGFESFIGDSIQPLDADDTLILVTSAGGAFALGNFEGVGDLPTHQEGQFDMVLLGPAADVYPTHTFDFFGF